MPSSENYKTIVKRCLRCNEPLTLNNNRDIERKKFCSRVCSSIYTSINRSYKIKEIRCSSCEVLFIPKVPYQKYCTSNCSKRSQVKRSYKFLNNNKEAYIKHLLYRKDRKNIPLEYILELYGKQQGLCALSGITLTFIKKTDGIKIHTNLSIDRIDSTKGYEIGNIQLVCAIVNIMKSTLTTQELKWWCSKIVEGGYSNS